MRKTLVLVPGTYYWNEELDDIDKVLIIEHPKLMNESTYSKMAIKYRHDCAKELESHYKRRGVTVSIINSNDFYSWKPVGTDYMIFYDPTDYDVSSDLIKLGMKMMNSKTFYFKVSMYDTRDFWTDLSLCNFARKTTGIMSDLRGTYDSECRGKLDIPMNTDVDDHPSSLTTRRSAISCLNSFIKKELITGNFCKYQDSIDFITDRDSHSGAVFTSHSRLSAALNIGIINPGDILERLREVKLTKDCIPSVEAYFRQIFGWREYMRMIWYKGPIAFINGKRKKIGTWNDFEQRRLESHYSFPRKKRITEIPSNHLVQIIEKSAHKYGYIHHIERLMILGNWMFLHCVDPVDVYHYFLGLTIDAYPWVMYGNVLYMSQYLFGAVYTRKAYYSSGNYIRKTSIFLPNSKVSDAIDEFDDAFKLFKYRKYAPLY